MKWNVQKINSLSSELAALRGRLVVFNAEVAAGASGLDVPALLAGVGSAKQTAQNATKVARQELADIEPVTPTASPTTPPLHSTPTTPPPTTPPPTTPRSYNSTATTPPPTTPPPTTPPPTTLPPTTLPPTTQQQRRQKSQVQHVPGLRRGNRQRCRLEDRWRR
nr:classical arabinogalactan protein 9-like [Penaeus vannamei]